MTHLHRPQTLMDHRSDPDARMVLEFLDARLPDHFWSKCIPEPNSGCWLWIGSLHRDGYGNFWIDRRCHLAHRVSYVIAKGAVADGLEIDHLCRTPCCVNPRHLEAVTHAENIARGLVGSVQRQQTACIYGHAFNDKNTYITHVGKRACRECNKQRMRRRRRGAR